MAVTNNLENTSLAGSELLFPVAGTTHIWQYSQVGTNASGYLVPVADTAGIVPFGYAETETNNTGSNGAASCPVQLYGFGVDSSLWVYNTSGATQAWVGTLVYFTDPQTVAASSSNSIVAGLVTQYLSATQVVVNSARRSAA